MIGETGKGSSLVINVSIYLNSDFCFKNLHRGRGRPDYREYRRYSPDRGPPVKRMRQEWGEDGRPLRYGGKFRLGNKDKSN